MSYFKKKGGFPVYYPHKSESVYSQLNELPYDFCPVDRACLVSDSKEPPTIYCPICGRIYDDESLALTSKDKERKHDKYIFR